MFNILTKNWWLLIIQGLLFILFGIIAIVNPTLTAATFAIWFAIFIMVHGFFAIVAAIRNWKTEEDKWLVLVEGIVSVIIGILLSIMPDLTLLVVSFTIAFWFLITGVLKIAMAIELRKEIKGEGWIILGGIISVLFGFLIFARPILGYSYLIWIIGFCSLFVGIAMIFGSFRLRKAGKMVKEKIAAELK